MKGQIVKNVQTQQDNNVLTSIQGREGRVPLPYCNEHCLKDARSQ